jgi:ABC-type branched-chain amino acid transport systems, ATPase component
VLSGIDLSIHSGEVVCIIGPNGAGKTTLMLSIMGAIGVVRGSVVFKDRNLTGAQPEQMVREGIALCPEGRRIFQQLSVEENIVAALVRGRSPLKADALDEAYTLFPILKDKRRDRAGGLSGGQQQMLAIARALASRPDLLMLDEPSLGLAPKIVISIFDRLLQLQSQGLTIAVVDQNVDFALEVADYAYVLESGKLALEGPAQKIRDDASLVAAFLHGGSDPVQLTQAGS